MLTNFINLSRKARSGLARPTDRLFPKAIRRGTSYIKTVLAHKNLKKILGTNLTLMFIAASLIPTNTFSEDTTDTSIIVENKINLKTKVSLQYPVKKIKITQGYKSYHPGLDLDGITGDEIRPIKDGVVELISTSKFAYGNAILINHGEGLSSLYAHLSKIYVFEGETVDTNTVIGEMGATGRSWGDHLHLEVRKNGIPINPFTILPR